MFQETLCYFTAAYGYLHGLLPAWCVLRTVIFLISETITISESKWTHDRAFSFPLHNGFVKLNANTLLIVTRLHRTNV
jgi:hypothetical protein